MGPDATRSFSEWDEVIEAINEFAALVERLAENFCGPTREDHDVAYCVHCKGGFCLRCGRADEWGVRCVHEPAWRYDI